MTVMIIRARRRIMTMTAMTLKRMMMMVNVMTEDIDNDDAG